MTSGLSVGAVALALVAVCSVVQPAHADAPALRRFALIASANDGGAGRSRLRFADSDAQAMARVLESLGGVEPGDRLVVHGATRARLRAAFDQLTQRLEQTRRSGTRHELFIYYSGHSDEQGLLLGGERVGYSELRGWIDSSRADVRIAVLDSCASGALIRSKGGVRRQSFLSDVSTQARGHAFLTASSADEAAQESDRIGAAFFTHYLVSGLRGAADANRDRRITLNEAYQFAYAETLRRTESSRVGAQHPAYDIQLAGTGDLVMTDLNATSARLVFAREVSGRLYVRDAQGRLLAELRKEPLYPVELGLEPGRYRVVLDNDGRPSEAVIQLSYGGKQELAASGFTPISPLIARTRGIDPSDPIGDLSAASDSDLRPYRSVPFDLVLAPGIAMIGRAGERVEHNFALGVVAYSDAVSGVQLSLGGNIAKDRMAGLQLSAGFNLSYGPVRGVQLGNIVNIARDGLAGLQIGAFANIGKGTATGAQVAMANYQDGDVRGTQIAVINAATQKTTGVAVGVANYSGSVAGAQIGVVNVGGAIGGTQIGVVNIASEFTGAQIGVVNVARRGKGASLGLLPLVGDGYNRVAVWSSDLSSSNLGFKLGTPWLYTVWGFGVTGGDRRTDDTLFALTGGIGTHLVPFARALRGRLFVDIDAVTTQLAPTDDFDGRSHTNLSSLRLTVGWQLMPRLAITGGPTFNVQTSWDGRDYETGLGIAEKVLRDGDTTVRLFPGFVLGVQI